MIRKTHLRIALAAGLLGCAPAWTAEPAGAGPHRCSQILGERERLACFDRTFPAGPESAALAESRAPATAPPPPAAPPPVVAAPVVVPATPPVAAPAPRAPAPTPAAATPATAAPPAAAPASQPVPSPAVVAAPVAAAAVAAGSPAFGDEQVKKGKAAREADASSVPKSLTAQVTNLKEVREDVWRMKLDNGQTWQQMDMTRMFVPQVGDTVEIQRKMMGGYTMALTGSKKSPWIRVTRVE